MNEQLDKLGYNGNLSLKPIGTQINFTPFQLEEYIKCKQDPCYFINNYCKIISLDDGLTSFKMFDYQEEYVKLLHSNRKVVAMLGRQMAKTTSTAAYILHYTIFNDHKTSAILANKAATAREVMSRIQLMFEELPKWLQHGIKEWNKGNIELENGSKIFTAATTASGIRGKSCVTGDTKVCVSIDDNIFYESIEVINNPNFIEIKENINMIRYAIYETKNNINNKNYIGFHSIRRETTVMEYNESGSIFSDGYLGSGKLLKQAIAKYNPENFSQKLLKLFDNKLEAQEYERKLVNKKL